VQASFTVAGDVASFDSTGFRDALHARFSDAEEVTIVVTSASVRVDATIVMPNQSAATSVASDITSTPTEDMQREWFASVGGGAGVKLASVRATVASVTVSAPSPPTSLMTEPGFIEPVDMAITAARSETTAESPPMALLASLIAGGVLVLLLGFSVCACMIKRKCAGRVGLRRARRNPHATKTGNTAASKKLSSVLRARTRVACSKTDLKVHVYPINFSVDATSRIAYQIDSELPTLDADQIDFGLPGQDGEMMI